MKKKNIFQLLTFLLLVGLWTINTDVQAAANKVCHYSFQATYADSDGENGTVTNTFEFDIKLQEAGNDGFDRYSVSDNSSGPFDMIKPRRGTSYGDYEFYVKHSDGCPEITIYQRRTGIAKKNTNQFYILVDAYDSQNETADAVRSACQGKDANTEVLSGYVCGNVFAPLSGEDVTPITTCDEEQIEQIKEKLTTAYEPIMERYRSLVEEIAQDRLDGSQFDSKDAAEKGCNALVERATAKTEELKNAYSQLNLGSVVKQEAEALKCNLPSDSDLLSNYERQITQQMNGLMGYGTTRKNDCINSANITSEEKTALKNDALDQLEDIKEENAQAAKDTTEKWKGYISSITSLGTDLNDSDINCRGLLGDDLLDIIDEIFGYVKIAAPILLLVLGSVDFAQVVLTEGTDNKDALKKATSKFVKRAIICVAIFFIPSILSYILHFIDGIGVDPLCGIK